MDVAGHFPIQLGHPTSQSHHQSFAFFTPRGHIEADDYYTVCTWAACCIAFFAFLRCGEFTCNSSNSNNDAVLSLEDIAIDSWDDPTIVHLMLRHSKSDIFGVGVTIHLGRTGTCCALCLPSMLTWPAGLQPLVHYSYSSQDSLSANRD